jgi:hypothetical protein
MCMRRLIEEGADLTALTNEGKSPVKLAEEMKCSLVFARALQDSGRYNDDLTPRVKPRLTQELANKIVFCSPFVQPKTSLAFVRIFLADFVAELIAVLDLDCVGAVLVVTILFVVVARPFLALRLEPVGTEFRHQGYTRRRRTNPQDSVPGRYIHRHRRPRCPPLVIHNPPLHLLRSPHPKRPFRDGVCDGHVLLCPGRGLGSGILAQAGGDFGAKEDCGGVGCSGGV